MSTPAGTFPTRKPAPRRFSAFLAALLLLFTWTGDAVGLHPCPHHAPAPVEERGGDPAGHGGHAAHGERSAHEGHGGAAARADAPAHPADDHGACTCAGSCLGGAALPVLFETFGAAPDAYAPGRPSVVPDAAALPDRFPPFLLPYGHAPPALRA